MESPISKNAALVFMVLSSPFLGLSAYIYLAAKFMKPTQGDAPFGYHLFYLMIDDYLGWAQFLLVLGIVILNLGAIIWAISWESEKSKWQQTNKIFH